MRISTESKRIVAGVLDFLTAAWPTADSKLNAESLWEALIESSLDFLETLDVLLE